VPTLGRVNKHPRVAAVEQGESGIEASHVGIDHLHVVRYWAAQQALGHLGAECIVAC
jgi:hypothetical protein